MKLDDLPAMPVKLEKTVKRMINKNSATNYSRFFSTKKMSSAKTDFFVTGKRTILKHGKPDFKSGFKKQKISGTVENREHSSMKWRGRNSFEKRFRNRITQVVRRLSQEI